MPKERFHLYLTDELLNKCPAGPSIPFDMPAFSLGTISPDIFYYDFPSFSLSSLGDALHRLMEREGISIICDWIARTPPEAAHTAKVLWALGFACHFMADAAWHPVINELSGSGLERSYSAGKRLSGTERHRLLESELEAFWLGKSAARGKYDNLLAAFNRDRGRLLEIASYYRRFIEFAAREAALPACQGPPYHPACAQKGRALASAHSSAGFGPGADVSEKRIARCFLFQNFLLRVFSNRMLSRRRDHLLSLPPTRFLGSLITPARPILPALLLRAMPEDRNPFTDYFMEKTLTSLKADLCGLMERLSQFFSGE